MPSPSSNIIQHLNQSSDVWFSAHQHDSQLGSIRSILSWPIFDTLQEDPVSQFVNKPYIPDYPRLIDPCKSPTAILQKKVTICY